MLAEIRIEYACKLLANSDLIITEVASLFRSERDLLQMLTLWSRTLEEVKHLLVVLSRESGVDLLEYLSTVAAQQTADFSTKVWAHLLCDSDDLAMPDLSYTFFKHALIDSECIDFQTIDQKKSLPT